MRPSSSSQRPLIGIVCCTRDLAGEAAQAVMTRYVSAAMRFANADAVLLPALPELLDAGNVTARIDGLLLTGSRSNVAAAHGGVADGDGPFDPARDRMVVELLAAAEQRRRPVFGICRGFQELNVALGGSLRAELQAEALAHHADGSELAEMFGHTHPVSLVPGGVLARAYGTRRLDVTSVHYQGIGRLADTLTAEAHAGDGLVEAVSGDLGGAPVIGVQWHPEWEPEARADRSHFFALFGRALRGASLSELAHAP